MGSEQESTELIADVVFVFVIIIVILIIVFGGIKAYSSQLGNLPKSFFGYILDKMGQRWWG